MVSFWPFKGQDNSAASFEKLLSSLSTKINKETARNDTLRQRQRRYRVLWTLYTTFTYLLALLILTLVTGWQNWSSLEYTALLLSPPIIYAIRTAIDAYYNYRLAASQTTLNDLHKQRDAAIAKLKEATKYNSTQQLLEKYGGAPARPTAPKRKPSGKSATSTKQPARTGIAPPPTANIPGRPILAASPPTASPQQQQRITPSPLRQQNIDPSADFAPNAFPNPPESRDVSSQDPAYRAHWYDRVLDIVLGDDETAPKNRIVLICASCRLVNGQAPPGTRTLEDVGQWRCMACHALNGAQSAGKEMIEKIVAGAEEADLDGGVKRRATTLDGAGVDGDEVAVKSENPDDAEQEEEDDDDDEGNWAGQAKGHVELEGRDGSVFANGLESPPASSTRSRVRKSKN